MSGAMVPYVVRQGDYLAKLAFALGFDADAVWNDPANAELKKLRSNPNVLAPGDILNVPAQRKETPLPIAKGTGNGYTANVPTVTVRVVFKQTDGTTLAGEAYELQGLADPDAKVTGALGGDGAIELDVPVDVRELTVLFPARHAAFALRIGEMDPMSEATGVRKRLRNLGFGDPRLVSFPEDEASLSEAIAAFERAAGREETGVLGASVIDALAAAHDV